MKRIIRLFLILVLIVFVGLYCNAQTYSQPKKIKAKGDYVHGQTQLIFPVKIDDYERLYIYSFDKKKTNVGITYESLKNTGKTTLSIYLYPAGSGTDGRLRDEYLFSLQSIANVSDKGVHAIQKHVSFKKDGYKINGYNAWIVNESNLIKSNLTVYECGKWFFKIRITTDILDSLGIDSLKNSTLDLFQPTMLVKNAPLNPKADIHFAKAAFCDSIMLGSAMGCALKKLEWALDNVDSLERASGFPDLYIGMHIEALKAFVNFEKEHNFSKSQTTIDYLKELNSIIDAGFLKEFIMQQYSMIMITPENMTFDFDAYENWKQSYPMNIDLSKRFYVISYSDK
ncbi:MAG: hypothetical protein WC319_12165 [Candidatus Paceibacterota bacterium]|jgi:hypothetical protein